MKSISQPLAVILLALVLFSRRNAQASTLLTTNVQNAGAIARLSNGPNRFEANYNIDTPGTLSLNGDSRFVLHRDRRFARVFVDGNPPPNGSSSYDDILALLNTPR